MSERRGTLKACRDSGWPEMGPRPTFMPAERTVSVRPPCAEGRSGSSWGSGGHIYGGRTPHERRGAPVFSAPCSFSSSLRPKPEASEPCKAVRFALANGLQGSERRAGVFCASMLRVLPAPGTRRARTPQAGAFHENAPDAEPSPEGGERRLFFVVTN